MTVVLAAAWHDAEAGFLRYHARPGFWIACAVLAALAIAWKTGH